METNTSLAPAKKCRRFSTLGRALKAALLAVAVQGLGIAPAAADVTVAVNALARGWYTSSGVHNTTDGNYGVGDNADDDVHNYFVFDLPNSSATIVSAELRMWNPSNGYISNDSIETFTLYAVTNSISSVISSTSFSGAAFSNFTDLGAGTSYGSFTVSSASNGTFVSIFLNSAFLAAAQAANAGQIAIGTALVSPDPDFAYDEYAFVNTGSLPADRVQLVVTTVPEPSGCGLALLGGAGLLALRRRRRGIA